MIEKEEEKAGTVNTGAVTSTDATLITESPAEIAEATELDETAATAEIAEIVETGEETEVDTLGEEAMEEPGEVEEEEQSEDTQDPDPTVIEEEDSTEDHEEEVTDENAVDMSDAFDIMNIFNEEASSSELGAGVHERVKLITVDPERRKDNNGNLVKKQLFLKFKKFTKEGTDVGEKEISFFLIDPAKDSAVSNLFTFIAQVRELLSVFLTEDEITAGFDPLSVLYDADNDDREEADVYEDFMYDFIKKRVLKKEKSYTDVETAICKQFTKLLEGKIGFDSKSFRLKLEESSDAKYIQIPRFDRFVEPAGVPKEDSVLYTNTNTK